MKYNVLILPIGTEIGLEINRALRHSKHFCVYGVSSDHNNHGRFVCDNYIDENLPNFTNADFWISLSRLVEDRQIDYVYPASPLLFDVLDGAPDGIMDKLLISDKKTIEICRSKSKTYNHFEGILAVPEVAKSSYPKFLKPDKGQGTSGCYKVNNLKEWASLANYLPDEYLCLKYIEGDEYTVDCFTDRFRRLRFVGPRIRNRIKNGISVNSQIVNRNKINAAFWDKVNQIAMSINCRLTMRGGWFFQVKGKGLTLLEIEPRIAGTSGIWRQVGINLPLLTLYDCSNQDIEIKYNNCDIELDRALKARYKTSIEYEHVYLDLDDTLIISDKVNTQLVSFIYQCRNSGKSVHLLTRNDYILQTLRKYGLCRSVFGDIFHVEGKKSSYIKKYPAIFIDDSFGERKEVKFQLNIPVFDVDAVECLMEG